MKNSFFKRLFCIFLSVAMLVCAPLSASALSLDDFTEAVEHKLDLIEYFEERAKHQLESNFDLFSEIIHNNNPFEFWWDVFKNNNSDTESEPSSPIVTGTNLVPSSQFPDSSDGSVFYSHTENLSSDDLLFALSYLNSSYSLGNQFFVFADFKVRDGLWYPSYAFCFLPSYSDDCRLTFYPDTADLILTGPYTGAFYRVDLRRYYNYDSHIPYQFLWKFEFQATDTINLSSGQTSLITRFWKKYYLGSIPVYVNGVASDSIDLPSDSWAHDFVLHGDLGGRWSSSNDQYILDLFVYYTGSDPNFDPADYVASGGLVYIDPSTNSRYLPWSDYVFFDTVGGGKISTMTNPGTVFHMHLDKIKDTLYRHRVGFGNWYAFVRITDSNGDTAYYAQQEINFNDVDSGVFSGTVDFPDWDDYEPDIDDDSTVPTVTINNYNDYTQFETAPNSFDFDAYADWIYTNLSILNDNVGTLNDNLLLFFDSWADFASDFYSFFTDKFNMIADHIDDTVDALARYIKDLNVVSVFNTNVIADNLLDDLKNALVPDADILTAFFYLGCPWYKQISDMFDFLSNYGSSLQYSQPEITLSLPYYYFTAAHEGDNLLFHDYTLNLSFLQNETLYAALTLLVRAATCFTCFRIGMSMFGVGVFKEVEAGDV